MMNKDAINKFDDSCYVKQGAKEIVKMLEGIEYNKAKNILMIALNEELPRTKIYCDEG